MGILIAIVAFLWIGKTILKPIIKRAAWLYEFKNRYPDI